METDDMIANTLLKLEKKNVNMMVANSLKEAGAGFNSDTNRVTIITPGQVQKLPLMTKFDVAHKILDAISEKRQKPKLR